MPWVPGCPPSVLEDGGFFPSGARLVWLKIHSENTQAMAWLKSQVSAGSHRVLSRDFHDRSSDAGSLYRPDFAQG